MRAHALFVLPRGASDSCKAGESDKLRLGGDAADSTSDGTRDLDQGESDHTGSYQESLVSDAVMEEHIMPAEETMATSEIDVDMSPSIKTPKNVHEALEGVRRKAGTAVDRSIPISMQAQLDQSAGRQPSRPESPYSNVDVLLLQWEDDDLKVDGEIKELEHVFATACHFTTHRWSIPSIEPEDSLVRRCLQFKRGKTENDLLILYYGGHARGDSQECFWAANQNKGSPELNWYNVQNILLGSPADVLLILDCCFATLAAKNSGTGANWLLGASAKESVTTGVSRNSFTSALTREIDRWADQYWTKNVTFTVQSIHQGLTFWDRDLAHTPTLLRLSDHDCHPTELTPLLYPQGRTQVPQTSTEPVDQNAHPSSSPPSPTLRVQGLPLSTDTHDPLQEKKRVFRNLRSYDTVLLVDDSDSMYGPRWDTTKHVLEKIASIAVLHDRDGVDIRFFNYYLEDDERLNLDSAEKVMNIFEQVDPFGSTRTADVLERELNDYLFEYRKNRRIKGLNLIVLTDGEPDDGQDVAGGIAKFAKKLEELEAPLLQVGIRFVQIGGDKKAAEFLRTLDDELQKKFSLDRDVSAHDGTCSSRLIFIDG